MDNSKPKLTTHFGAGDRAQQAQVLPQTRWRELQLQMHMVKGQKSLL